MKNAQSMTLGLPTIMDSPIRIIHALAGGPIPDKCHEIDDLCRMCALPATVSMQFERWQGSSFTDQNKVKCTSSDHVCAACIWGHSWVQPPGYPPADAGKRGVCLRLFSHLWDSRGYVYANKGGKAVLRDWLRGEKSGSWFAAIADTGQKHVLPYTQINPPGSSRGLIRFEERDVIEGDWALLDDATELLTDGVTKEAVDTGEYSANQWIDSANYIREFEKKWSRMRGSGWFDLCLWLAQRDEAEWKARSDERKRQRAAGKTNGRHDPRVKKILSSKRGKPTETLGSVAGSNTNGGETIGAGTGLGYRGESQAQPVGPEQLSLFSD